LSQACEQLDASLLAGIPTQPCGLDEKSRQETLVRLWRAAGYSAADFIRGGDELQKAKDWDQAEAYYHRALLLDPQATVAWYDLGELYLSRGQPEAALAAYGQVGNSELEPLLAAPAHARRGTILADARRWADAAAELAQAVALVPDEGRYQLDYGWYLYKTGQNLDRARAALTAAADLMPQSPWPHLRLAELAEAEKNYDEMLAQSQQAAELQPTLFWSWMFQGWAFANLEQEEKAEQTFRRAMELSPDQAVAHVALGLVLEQMGRVAEAVPEYEQAVRLMPDSIEYNVDLAQAYLATGETSQAIQTYRRVLELDPENKVAIQALEDLGNE
jgi:tetratricopeptide (TPR) repeat protein